MISYLEGIIKLKSSNYFIVFVNGVGFKVFTPTDVITNNNLGQKITIFTYTHVKDDALELYGFPSFEDLVMFELLLGVSGIGPKTALSIFSNGKLGSIKEAIFKGDVDFFTSIPRLGKKNAQKIIIELRPKLGSLSELDLTNEGGETKEIVEALRTFGFSTSETKEAINFLRDFEGTTSDKIKQALKFLGKK